MLRVTPKAAKAGVKVSDVLQLRCRGNVGTALTTLDKTAGRPLSPARYILALGLSLSTGSDLGLTLDLGLGDLVSDRSPVLLVR